jgi:outer membrane protein OmpA-like peptidoglycan-associated protein/Tol biopolymer transport system component
MNKIILLSFFLGSFFYSFGQQYSSSSKKAIKLLEEAMDAPRQNKDVYGRENYKLGLEIVQKSIEKDPNFWEAYLLAGEFAEMSNQLPLAIDYYKKAIQINPNHSPTGNTYFFLSNLQFATGDYASCIKTAQEFLLFKSANPANISIARKLIESSNFAIQAISHPSNFKPQNMGPAINTKDPEYFPTITVDGKTILFTRLVEDNRVQGPYKKQEDFYISHLVNNAWVKAEPMPTHINTVNNEGAPTIAADGRSLIFVACPDASGSDYGEGRQGKGSCDLFITKKLGNRWGTVSNLAGSINSNLWETQPSLSADGKTIYFIRSIRGQNGQKNSDIYTATLNENGTWGQPVRLPNNVNTTSEEESVLIHPDGKTLYFASRGHIGMGGFDLYMTRLQENGTWSDPINLGYPINTKDDENSLMVSPDGEIGFFASNREGGFGDLDIYYFDMPPSLKPIKTLYFEGLVSDAITKKPIPGKFQLIDLKTGKEVIRSEADAVNGEFTVSLPVGKEYAVNVSYPGYNFFSQNFNMEVKENQEAVHLDINLVPIGSDLPVVLANVFFDLNKSNLRPESFIELNKLRDLLIKNPTLTIEIGGHTDTRGDANENQQLSEGRANAVKNYLIEQGIEASRLSAKGYGESQPKISDDEIAALKSTMAQEKAHQQNRRTEYKFVK